MMPSIKSHKKIKLKFSLIQKIFTVFYICHRRIAVELDNFFVLFCNILTNLLQIPIEFVFDEFNRIINPQYHGNSYVYLTSPFLVF